MEKINEAIWFVCLADGSPCFSMYGITKKLAQQAAETHYEEHWKAIQTNYKLSVKSFRVIEQ